MHKTIKPLPAATATVNDPRWQQVVARDHNADGQFFYAVTTTGIYCRPSCGARQPRPEHVNFYLTPAAAEAAGFRACKRCKPNQHAPKETDALKITHACRLIETSERLPGLAELAEQAGLSTSHFHRLFKSVTGLTPKAYASAHKAKRLRQLLADNMPVTDAIYAAGYESSSPVYAAANPLLGMKPRQYAHGGANTTIHFALTECTLGSLLVAISEKGVCAISLGDEPEHLLKELQDRFPHANLIGADSAFEAMIAKVIAFVEAPNIGLELPLDIRGTAFQQRVWQALQEIPYGQTTTYTELAHKIGKPKAIRAVASACAANTLAIAIPCHRVIRQDGSLSGYRWGVMRKRAILKKESKK
jgi:AraC family transcriptional regulator of adaptative response/methylated-DNA-[protein]-cysteine methyltransferase